MDMGSKFSWTNRRSNNTILKKLDRVLVNVKWNCKFTGSRNFFLPFSISYHSPILVKMASLLKREIPFKFFDFWANHSLFLPLISEAWCKEVTSTPMFILCNKLKNVKGVVKEFNQKYFGKISERMLEVLIN